MEPNAHNRVKKLASKFEGGAQPNASKRVCKSSFDDAHQTGVENYFNFFEVAKTKFEEKNTIHKARTYESEKTLASHSLMTALQEVRAAEKQLSDFQHEPQRITLNALITEREGKRSGGSYPSPPPAVPPKLQGKYYANHRRATIGTLDSFMTESAGKEEQKRRELEEKEKNLYGEGKMIEIESLMKANIVRKRNVSDAAGHKKMELTSSMGKTNVVSIAGDQKKRADSENEEFPFNVPQPDKITARPESSLCSQSDEQTAIERETGNICVSLVAAPNVQSDGFNESELSSRPSNNVEYECWDASSTVYSFPWDLPPPVLVSSTSDTKISGRQVEEEPDFDSTLITMQPPMRQEKWATLHKHMLERSSPSLSLSSLTNTSTLTREDDSSDVFNWKNLEKPMKQLILKQQAGADRKTTSDSEASLLYDFTGVEKLGDLYAMPFDCIEADTIDRKSNYCYAEMEHFVRKHPPQRHAPKVPPHPSEDLIANAMRHQSPPAPSKDEYKGVVTKKIRKLIPHWRMPKLTHRMNSETMKEKGDSWWDDLAKSPESFGPITSYLDASIQRLFEDNECAFSKHVTAFIDCTREQKGKDVAFTMQSTRQFMNGIPNYLKHNLTFAIEVAMDLERKKLQGDEFLDVDKKLYYVVQRMILRPIHAKLIKVITETSPKFSSNSIGHLMDRIKLKMSNIELDRLRVQILEPTKALFTQLQGAYKPEGKLDYLIQIFRLIDEKIFTESDGNNGGENDIFDPAHCQLYAMVFGLSGLLCAPVPTSKGEFYNPIKVQHRYIEGLISRTELQANADWCRCLSGLVLLWRHIDHNDPTWFKSMVEVITRSPIAVRTTDDDRSGANCRGVAVPGVASSTVHSEPSAPSHLSLGDALDSAAYRTKKFKISKLLRSRPNWASTDNCSSTEHYHEAGREKDFYVLVTDESTDKFVLQKFLLRPSLTVRELCNIIAQRMKLFNPKAFGLYFYSVHGDSKTEEPMNDFIHLDKFLALQIPLMLEEKPRRASSQSNLGKSKDRRGSIKLKHLMKRSVPNLLEIGEPTLTSQGRPLYLRLIPYVFIFRRTSTFFLYAENLIEHFFGMPI